MACAWAAAEAFAAAAAAAAGEEGVAWERRGGEKVVGMRGLEEGGEGVACDLEEWRVVWVWWRGWIRW